EDAIKKGAVAVLSSTEGQYLYHPNPRLAYALLCSRFYQYQPEIIAAVTGTNGKTSIAHFCRSLWEVLGHKSAFVGTTGITGMDAGEAMTTPDAAFLHHVLADMHKNGITRLAMEASSHGLDQHRMDGVNIKIAAFSNITR